MSFLKTCARCRVDKSFEYFYKHAKWIDGFHPYCKACFNEYTRTRREKRLANVTLHHRWKRKLVNHAYFTEIATPIAAYILGFIAADGNILAKQNRISIEISDKDAKLLEMIRNEIAPTAAITIRHRKGYSYCILAFVSHQMAADLARHAITPAKSRTLTWPLLLHSKFEREFILGYFDGDGSITHRKSSSYPYLMFTSGSKRFLLDIQHKIHTHTGIRISGPWIKPTKNTTYTIRAAGKNAEAISTWFSETGLGLARKQINVVKNTNL